MENLITLDMVTRNEHLLRHRLFTELQLNILKKRLQKKSLDVNEKTYYYKFIKPKIKAMLSFFNLDEGNINGREYIFHGRIAKAVSILRKFEKIHKSKRIMLSGSFLFNREYNDIDIFVFTKYNKEDYVKSLFHVNFLKESAVDSLFFCSLSQISISNFSSKAKNEFVIDLRDVLQTYEILVNRILSNEECSSELRDFLVKTEYVSKGIVINPKQLYALKEKGIFRKNITFLSNTLINALLLGYNNKILKQELKQQIAAYRKLLDEYKGRKNLKIYINTYNQAMELAS